MRFLRIIIFLISVCFISAPFQVRVQHVMDIRNMNLKQAVRFLKQMDKQHKKYIMNFIPVRNGKTGEL